MDDKIWMTSCRREQAPDSLQNGFEDRAAREIPIRSYDLRFQTRSHALVDVLARTARTAVAVGGRRMAEGTDRLKQL